MFNFKFTKNLVFGSVFSSGFDLPNCTGYKITILHILYKITYTNFLLTKTKRIINNKYNYDLLIKFYLFIFLYF